MLLEMEQIAPGHLVSLESVECVWCKRWPSAGPGSPSVASETKQRQLCAVPPAWHGIVPPLKSEEHPDLLVLTGDERVEWQVDERPCMLAAHVRLEANG